MTSSAGGLPVTGWPDCGSARPTWGTRPPSPGQVLAALPGGPVVVLPLLLTGAYHSKTDLPAVLRAASARSGGQLEIRYGDPLGPHPLLVTALERRLAEAGVPPGQTPAPRWCSPPPAPVTRRPAPPSPGWQRDGGCSAAGRTCVPAYASAAAPPPGGAVSALLAGGARRVVVASYLLAPGRFAEQVRDEAIAAGAAAVSAPLGAAPELADIVLARYAAARAGQAAAAARIA